MKKFNGGYVGLLMLLITVLIMAWITWKLELQPATQSTTKKQGSTTVETPAELQAIQAAQNTKALLETQSRAAAQVQE